MGKLKKGDKVRVTKLQSLDEAFGIKVGDIFTIKKVESDGFYRVNDDADRPFSPNQLKLVSRKDPSSFSAITSKSLRLYG